MNIKLTHKDTDFKEAKEEIVMSSTVSSHYEDESWAHFSSQLVLPPVYCSS